MNTKKLVIKLQILFIQNFHIKKMFIHIFIRNCGFSKIFIHEYFYDYFTTSIHSNKI